MFACHEGHAEVVKLLLAVSRINVNVQDKVSASFSHLASAYSLIFSCSNVMGCCVRMVKHHSIFLPIINMLKWCSCC